MWRKNLKSINQNPMELKEYIKIIKNNVKLFWLIIIIVIAASFVYFYIKPVSYSTSLALNITRGGSSASADYNYGGFYRLQADEKFAETVVRWLKSPRIVLDIFQEAGLDNKDLSAKKLSKMFKAEKMSSQVVLVSFSSESGKQAVKTAQSIVKIIFQNTQSLNKDQKEKDWFEIIALEPVIIKDQNNFLLILSVSLAGGIFLAFWIVMLMHYFKD